MQAKIVETGRQDAWLYVSSDHHIGASNTDYGLIKAEVEAARRLNAVCILNGDHFDAILPHDRKRFTVEAMHERVRNDSSLNSALEWAVELFAPIAPQIAAIGHGNHDESVVKHHSVHLGSMLAAGLTGYGFDGTFGGPEGYVLVRLTDGSKHGTTIRVFYTHGAGGESPVTGGTIDFYRLRNWVVDADVITIGHKHNHLYQEVSRQRVTRYGCVYYDTIHCVMTGSYGYRTARNYASLRGMPPKPKGGAFMRFVMKPGEPTTLNMVHFCFGVPEC